MKIVQTTGGIAGTNSYLIVDETTGKAVIFDAPNDTVKPLLEEAKRNNWDVIGLWLTHGHFDHIADHAEVTSAFPNAKVLIHRLDEPMLRRPISSFFQLPFTIPPRGADAYLDDGQELLIGSIPVKTIHTPGHAPGHIMFYFPNAKIVVGGDLIIMGAIGRTDLPGAEPGQMNPSIRKVMQLPLDTTLLPGHGEPSKLSDELAGNPYVREAVEYADEV